jgi:microsomal prostaglandin-E synthase 2
MGNDGTLHLLYTCPFCWKVRGMIEYLKLDIKYHGINGLRAKKELKFVEDWNKVPVFTDANGKHVVDSTPIMKHLDDVFNGGSLRSSSDQVRQDEWLEWCDSKLSKATIPILYGGFFSALSTTRRVSKEEKFGFVSRRMYAWLGFPIMWGIIARSRVKKDGRSPQKLWHDLLDEFTSEFGEQPFFGGSAPDLVDFAAFGYMRSISPFKQFSLLTSHELGMTWYTRMMDLVS